MRQTGRTAKPWWQLLHKAGCLFMKRLERGRFLWPSAVDGAVSISAGQVGYLLEGIDWRHPRKTWAPEAAG